MERPNIKDFFPKETTWRYIDNKLSDEPELYRLIQALDSYIDELENEIGERPTIQLDGTRESAERV